MKLASRRWLYFVSGLILLGLLILSLQNLTNNVTADQGINREANLTLNRTITNQSGSDVTNGIIQRGESFFLNYRITPGIITGIPKPTSQQIRISNITFTEVLPANIEINTKLLPSGFTSSGSKSIGYTINANLGDINYHWDSATQSLKPDLTSNSSFNGTAIVFSLSASSTVSKDYTFADSKLDYNDLHEISSATPTPTPTSTFDPTKSNSGSTLGVIGDYGLFVLKNGSTTGNITINGNLAVGGDLSLANTSGGGTISGNVIVGNNFNYYGANQNQGNGGNIGIGGKVIYGTSFNYGTTSLSGIKGTRSQEDPMKTIDFKTVEKYWISKSKEYGMLTPNGTVAPPPYNNGDQLVLEVMDRTLPIYIFTITEDQISKAKGILINTPENSTVIINIMGYSGEGENKDKYKVLDMSQWTKYNGKDADYNKIEENTKKAQRILYNFPEARSINITRGQIGTFLAPLATVEATNGNITGALIASSWDFGNNSGLLVNVSPFKGELPIIPTPTPSATASPSPSSPPVAIPHATKGFSSVKVSVFSLRITGNTNVFKNKSIDLTLITDNLPVNAGITWSLLNDGGNYATLTAASVDKKNYRLTGSKDKDGIIVSVTAGGATTTHVVNVIPFQLTGLRAIEEIEIGVGDPPYDLNKLLWITPNEMTINDIKNDLEWTSADTSIASFGSPLTDESSKITGIVKGGPIIVTVLYTPSAASAKPIQTTIKVKVIAKENGDRY